MTTPHYPSDTPPHPSDTLPTDLPTDPPTNQPTDPLVARELGGWFNLVFATLRRGWPRLLGLQALQLAVQLALGAALVIVALLFGAAAYVGALGAGGPEVPPVALVVVLVAGLLLCVLVLTVGSVWTTAASVWVIVHDAVGRPVGVIDALRLSARRVGPLIGWGALVWLAFVVIATVAGGLAWLVGSVVLEQTWLVVLLGVVLVGVPVVWLGVILAGTLVGTVVIERRGPARCPGLVKGRWWPTCGRLVLAWMLGCALLVATSFVQPLALAPLGGGIGGPGADPANTMVAIGTAVSLSFVVQLVAGMAFGMFFAAVSVVTYAELRGHRDGSTTSQMLAAELAR